MEGGDITRTWHDLYVMLGTSAAALITTFIGARSNNCNIMRTVPVLDEL